MHDTAEGAAEVVPVTAAALVDEYRIRQAAVAFRDHRITEPQWEVLDGEASDASLIEIERAMEAGEYGEKARRNALMIWTLMLLSRATTLEEGTWTSVSERLRDIGYRIPEKTVPRLARELALCTDVIAGRKGQGKTKTA